MIVGTLKDGSLQINRLELKIVQVQKCLLKCHPCFLKIVSIKLFAVVVVFVVLICILDHASLFKCHQHVIKHL